MLPTLKELDEQVSLAEQEVARSDEHLRGSASGLWRRWSAGAPVVAAVAVVGLLAAVVLQSRRSGGRLPDARPPLGWHRLLSPLINLGIARGVTALTALIAGFAARKKAAPPITVPHLDLDRYAGLWYEIARLPLRHEDDCASDVTALYEWRGNSLHVINRCKRRNGRTKLAAGRARIVDMQTQAKLQVSFAPAFLDIVPFVWGDYWVLDLADDYSGAMVGTPDRKHLWLLARTPSLPGAQLNTFIARAEQQAYDVAKLQYTRHTVRHAAVSPQSATELPPREAEPARVEAAVE
jgi:apolipoprotein D and lipocalin family protein